MGYTINDEREKELDQIGEATYPDHIREEPREKKKKNQKQKERRTWICRPGSRTVRGAAWVLLSLSLFFFFFSLGSSLSFIRFINQVLETRFSCAHVEKYATSEMIRP